MAHVMLKWVNLIGPFVGFQDSGSSVSEADKKKKTVSLLLCGKDNGHHEFSSQAV